MLLGTLGAGLLGNILTGQGTNRAGEGISRAGYGNKKVKKKAKYFLIPPHPLTSFEIQMYYQNEARFNGVYFRDNLKKIKDGAYLIILDEYSDIGTHWFALYVQNNEVTCFDSFGVDHIPKEIRTFISNKDIKKYFQNTSI